MLQRLAEIVGALAQLPEQARVFDRDHRLTGEARHQVDLPLGERPHLLPIDRDGTDQFALPQHRDDEQRAGVAAVDEVYERRLAFHIGLFLPGIGDVNDLPRLREATERKVPPRTNDGITLTALDMPGRQAVQRDRAEAAALGEP